MYFIAEAGVNHNGDLDTALRLVEAASNAGANAVKFQTFDVSKLVSIEARTLEYQRAGTGREDQLSMLSELELSPADFEKIKATCDACGIEFLSTPFDSQSLRALLDLGMERIKVPSGEITNWPFLKEIAAVSLPVILSTGMSYMEEVEQALNILCHDRRDERSAKAQLVVLHCTSAYPTRADDVNLLAMRAIHERFGVDVGLSDHTTGIEVPLGAVGMGAVVIEKHFTLDRSMNGPDHQASIEPETLKELIRLVRNLERAMGDGEKRPMDSELPARAEARRSVVLVADRSVGDVLSRGDLDILRPGRGIHPGRIDELVGRRLRVDLPAGSVIAWNDLE